MTSNARNDELNVIAEQIFKRIVLAEESIDSLINSYEEDKDEFGINLKNSMEKNVFNNFFKEKQNKMDKLNKKIDSLKKRRLSTKLDKLRSDIQIMEKQRCWETIQNNRLYSKLNDLINENDNLNPEDTNKLRDIMQLYVSHGIHYNNRMNDLYLVDLNKMLSNKSIFDNSKNIVLTVSSKKTDDSSDNDTSDYDSSNYEFYDDDKNVEIGEIII